MRRITSSGGRAYHYGVLRGDLPKDVGPYGGKEIRLVLLEMDCGTLGAEEALMTMQVVFNLDGEPVLLNDVHLSGPNRPLTVKEISDQAEAIKIAATKPIIDLT